jgi:hypothetical protein
MHTFDLTIYLSTFLPHRSQTLTMSIRADNMNFQVPVPHIHSPHVSSPLHLHAFHTQCYPLSSHPLTTLSPSALPGQLSSNHPAYVMQHPATHPPTSQKNARLASWASQPRRQKNGRLLSIRRVWRKLRPRDYGRLPGAFGVYIAGVGTKSP